MLGYRWGRDSEVTKTLDPENILLQAKDLNVYFTLKKGGFGRTPVVVRAVDGLSFTVRRGSTYGIVGESGCGKSTTAMAVMRLAPLTSGSIEFEGIELSGLRGAGLRNFRRNLQIIFQDPYSSLDPRRRAGNIVREPLDRMGIGSKKEREEWISELFHRVGLRPEQAQLFPHQFSGGQRQRIGIARALSSRPKLIVCDEPVSALDVAIQAQILNLLMELQKDFGLTYLFISHDLGVVKYMCDDISVMYLGRIMEEADRIALFARPQHPYTKALLSAVPTIDSIKHGVKTRIKLEGDPPSPISPPSGCVFHTRCSFTVSRCCRDMPQLKNYQTGHRVACHLVDENGFRD
ncbi:MAG: ATP-binding cassette domain-containing protein [Desulfobacterales bacterium]|jgi:peptide/nickel transport system ATP-binding protein